MNYVIIVLLIGINIILYGISPKKNKDEVLRSIEINNRRVLLKAYKRLNISVIVFNSICAVIQILIDRNFIVDLILTILLIGSFILLTLKKYEDKPKYNVLGDNNELFYRMIINSVILLLFVERIAGIKDLYDFGYASIIGIIPVIINIVRLAKLLKKNKSIVVYKSKPEKVLNDIKTSLEIELNILARYLGIGFMIVFLLYVRIPFAFIMYILITLLMLLIYNGKVNKIKREKKKVHESIFHMHQMPGPMYTMQFKKDINFTTNIIIMTVMFALLSVISYVVGEVEFILIGFDVILIALYLIITARKRFIYSIYSLNKEHINKEKYSVNINDKISNIIDYKNYYLNINFNKIVYIDKDNNIYMSEEELYNIKELYEDLEIYINSTNINDYIVVEEEYY